MQVDQTRTDDQAVRLEHQQAPAALRRGAARRDLANPPVGNPDVGDVVDVAGRVDDPPAADQNIQVTIRNPADHEATLTMDFSAASR